MKDYTLTISGTDIRTTFQARNINHAVRRVMKTLVRRIDSSATIWHSSYRVARIRLNTTLGGRLVINGADYDKATWYEAFPG